jgi:hypothetical protein
MRAFLGRRTPSPAMAVAFVALLVALSGTAVALPGRNSVDSGDIQRGAVTNPKLARGSVTTTKLRNNSVTGPKIRNGAVNGAKVARNSLTGLDINESTLGTVPRADAANTATSAERASTAGHANTAGNASTVGGHAAGNLVRVAFASANSSALVATDGTALTTAIAAPSAGFLVINAGSDVFATTNAATLTCSIAVDGTQSAPSVRTIELTATAGGNSQEDCTTETVVQVAAGNHTVNFNYTGLVTGTTVDASSLQVLFVPFGSTGAVP